MNFENKKVAHTSLYAFAHEKNMYSIAIPIAPVHKPKTTQVEATTYDFKKAKNRTSQAI